MSTEKHYQIEIPPDVKASLDNGTLNVSGNLGAIPRRISNPQIKVKIEDNKVIVSQNSDKRNSKIIAKTTVAHIKNMINGVKYGYTYNLKICSSHFPISLKVDKDYVVITNFLGEKTPRKSKILPGAKVVVAGDLIDVTGFDLEKTGQTAANIEKATNIRNRDRRVFQDGIFITKKPEN